MLKSRQRVTLGGARSPWHPVLSRNPRSAPRQLPPARRLRLQAADSDRPASQKSEIQELEFRRQESSSSTDTARTLPGARVLPAGEVLQGKYVIKGVLGSGSNAITYQATGPGGVDVAIKALSLSALRDWKQLELFQREAKTLANLEHPSIPKYLDYFEEDSDRDRCFYLVQQVVPGGRSLAQMVGDGMRATEEEASRIAQELLSVLAYLTSLRPPVVHRDIKPENIVIEGGRWGGRVYVIDFGGVQGVASASDAPGLASTMIVGTYGYMAPEQFRGAAQTASDAYSVGGTLLFLLTGQAPSAFSQERMRIQWRGSPALGPSSLSPRWEALLDGLLEPVAEDRLTAQEALRVLKGETVSVKMSSSGAFAARRASRQAAQSLQPPLTAQEAYAMVSAPQYGVQRSKPAGSRVILDRSPNRLDIEIPPKGLGADTVMTGAFAVVWNGFVAVWTVGALAGGGILFALFSLPFWLAGAQLAKQAVGGFLTKERMAIGRNKFRIGQELALLKKDGQADFLGGQNEKLTEGLTSQLTGARVVTTMIVNGSPQTAIEVVEGINKYRFGEGLELPEQQWLVYEINAQLQEMRGQEMDYEAMPPPEAPKVYYDRDQDANQSLP